MVHPISLVSTNDDYLYNVHAFLHFLAWGSLIDVGILVARTMKAKKSGVHYQTLHGSIMTVTSLTSSVSISLIVYNFGFTLHDLLVPDIHKLLGFSLIGFSYLAASMGAITVYKLRRGGEVSYLFRKIHRIVGYSMYTVTKTNLVIGSIYLGGSFWTTVLVIYLICIITIHVTVYRLYQKHSETYVDPPLYFKEPTTTDHQKLITMIEDECPTEKIQKELSGIKWVLFGNRVYDITKFVHPGGEFLINNVIGREVSRYLYGAYPSESTNIKAYTHSSFAFEFLEKFYIGKIKHKESILVPVNLDINESVISSRSSSSMSSSNLKLSLPFLTKDEESYYEESTYKKNWKIVSKEDVTSAVTRFDFNCEQFNAKRFGTGINWFGRYFLVRVANKNSPRRPYTVAMCLDPLNIQIRTSLMNYLEEVMSGQHPELNFSEDYFLTKDRISLFIKNYPKLKGLSKIIHECDINSPSENKFILEGPIGLGLQLSDINSGTICIICSGTGIIPFLDYLSYILSRTTYEIIKVKNKEAAKTMMNKLGVDFEEKINTHKIHLIGAFQSQNDVLGLDILEKLAKVNEKYKLERFAFELTNCEVEHLQNIPKKIDENYLKTSIPKNAERFYVCGPPEFSRLIPRILMKAGINQERIVLV